MAGLLSEDPRMREMQLAAMKGEEEKNLIDPSVKERLKANKEPFNNPFSLDKFGANNPELQLVKDSDTQEAMKRQSFMRGLGDAGQAIMANSRNGGAKAISAGMSAFQGGSDAEMTKGLLMNDKKVAQDKETAKQEGWEAMENDPENTRSKTEALKFSRLMDDPSLMKDWMNKPKNLSMVDVNKATPASVKLYQDSVDKDPNGIGDHSKLIYPSSVKKTTTDGVKTMKMFEDQIGALLGFTFTENSDGSTSITGFNEKEAGTTRMQAEQLLRVMSEETWTNWYNDKSSIGSAVNDTARSYETTIPDPDNPGKFKRKWLLPKDVFIAPNDPAGIL